MREETFSGRVDINVEGARAAGLLAVQVSGVEAARAALQELAILTR